MNGTMFCKCTMMKESVSSTRSSSMTLWAGTSSLITLCSSSMTKKMAVAGSISFNSIKTARSQSARFKTPSGGQLPKLNFFTLGFVRKIYSLLITVKSKLFLLRRPTNRRNSMRLWQRTVSSLLSCSRIMKNFMVSLRIKNRKKIISFLCK